MLKLISEVSVKQTSSESKSDFILLSKSWIYKMNNTMPWGGTPFCTDLKSENLLIKYTLFTLLSKWDLKPQLKGKPH